jgi:hypothetical protein
MVAISASNESKVRRLPAKMRGIFDFSAESAEIADWMAEVVEFELSGDFVHRSVSHAKTSGSSNEAR